MKIMYLLFSFTVGGTEKLVTSICNEMYKKGYDIFLYIINRQYSKEMLDDLFPEVKVCLQNRLPGEKNILKTMSKIEKYIRNNKIDVIHCNSFNSPELLFLAKLLHPSIRIAYTIHDMNQWCNLSKMRSIYRNIICNKIIAISRSVEQDILACGAKPSKVSVVYNAINVSSFNAKELHFYKGDEFIVGNVARIMPNKKGQDILIRAIAKVKKAYPAIKCMFAGEIPENQRMEYQKLLKLVKELGLEENIEFLGNVVDVQGFLKNIDIFVLPSRFEGFGISLVEAMSMGIPCIASNLNGPAEIIGDNEHGILFAAGSQDSLAEKILFVIENYEELKMVRDVNIAYVKSRYNISNMCRALEELY